ncbi:MAG: helix-turn-helix transcriptional regulator [Flavobacteriia bacterium]|nr:helix-turn-helix transcriptional regulator [Flavobacteriia bacterium]
MSNTSKVVIGERIKAVVEERGMKISHFAKMINRTRQNVHNIFGRHTIDTDLLLEISRCLNYDFFSEYSQILNTNENMEAADQSVTYSGEKDGNHIHIHLPKGPQSPEDKANIIEAIQLGMSGKKKKAD